MTNSSCTLRESSKLLKSDSWIKFLTKSKYLSRNLIRNCFRPIKHLIAELLPAANVNVIDQFVVDDLKNHGAAIENEKWRNALTLDKLANQNRIKRG